MSTTTLPEAIKVLQDALSEDKEQGSYFDSWKANIAMAFYDECNRFCKANKKKVISNGAFAEVGNNAAKNFLEIFIKK